MRADLCLSPNLWRRRNPDSITREVGLEPTSSQRKGATSTNAIGRTRVAPLNGWFLSSEQHVTSKDVRRHLDWLVRVLESHTAGLRRLQELDGVRMGVHCVWWSAGSGGPALWPEQMRALADLNLECSFDVYFFEDEEEQKSVGARELEE